MPYIGNQPGTGVRSRFIYTATASQTTFSGADDNSKTLKYADSDYIDVYLNGVCLVPGTDYTASTKTSVVLTQAASLNDTLEVVAYDIATIADTVSKADGGTFNDGITITTADNTTQLTLESTDADANSGPVLELYRNSSSPADDDVLGEIEFHGENDADEKIQYGLIAAKLQDASDGTEDVRLSFKTITAGTERERITIQPTEVVINEDSQDLDFRVESDGDANALLVDAGNESVGLFADSDNTSKNKVAVGLTGTVVSGDTDGATIGKNAIFKLFDDTNWSSTDSTIFLMGGGTGGAVGQIASAIGFARESNTNWGTQLKFYTHPTATSDLDDLDERMRIDAIGNVLVGTTTGADGITLHGQYSNQGLITIETTNSGGGDLMYFRSAGATDGSISTNGSSTSYNTSSDYRLKENVTDITDGITRVKQLAPKRFNFIVDADTTVDGFLAHEASTVVPEAITGTKDEVEVWTEGEELPDGVSVGDNKLDDDGNTIPVMQGIDQSKLVPLLTAALQEAIAKIETLETKVAALEAE